MDGCLSGWLVFLFIVNRKKKKATALSSSNINKRSHKPCSQIKEKPQIMLRNILCCYLKVKQHQTVNTTQR